MARPDERLAAVLEIGAAISAARDIDQLLGHVVDRLSRLLEAEAATLFVLDQEKQELWSKVLRGSTLQEIRVPAASGLVGDVLKSAKPVLVADAYEDKRFNPDVDRKSGFRTRSVLAVPLRHASGQMLGILEVMDRRVNVFTAEDVALVTAVAAQIAAVLENVRLYEQLSWRNAELELLFEVEQAISSTETESELITHILTQATSVLGAQAASILIVEGQQGTLHYKNSKGALQSTRVDPSRNIAGEVARSGKSARLTVAPHYDKALAKRLGVTVKSLLCVPIQGETVGALELLSKPGGFTEADERLARVLAGQTGRAIRWRAEREAGERKARMESIGQMLSGVLHDLRTPLTVISGYAQMVVDEDDRAARQETVAIMERQLEQVNAMTRETLAFARGERSLLRRKLYLQKFLAEVEEYLRKDFAATEVELKVVPNYTGSIRADETKLKRLVYNLARNAAQAMEERGGKFTVTSEKEDGQLVLRFSDSGPGIPPEIADNLFESFVTAGKREGTGLGLAIVKTIAEEHGGTVTFQSRPGKGTTFEVKLPVLA